MKILFSLCVFAAFTSGAQSVRLLTSGAQTSLRGLSVVDEKIVWASGTNGMVSRSVDGGRSWQWFTVKNFEKTDFRDIEAFDSSNAIIMGISEPALILKTTNGGTTWKVVFKNEAKGMFLDAMDFYDRQTGMVVGDPLNNKFFVARTVNGGEAWSEIPVTNQFVADSGEACFASSGTNIRLLKNKEACFVSGAVNSRLFMKNTVKNLPLIKGKESTGANSIACKKGKIFIVVGGDFKLPGSTFRNCAISTNKGKTWTLPVTGPHGYRSCVEYIDNNKWVTCGLNGIDFSGDNGKKWKWISRESFHVCRKAKKGKTVFFAGENGKIGKLVL